MDSNAQILRDKIRERHFSAARFKVNLMTTQVEKRKEVSRIMKEAEEYEKEKEKSAKGAENSEEADNN